MAFFLPILLFSLPLSSVIEEANFPYDCRTSVTGPARLWSLKKQEKCCVHFGVGCPPPIKHYNCNVTNIHTWSDGKKFFCCARHRVGCMKSGVRRYGCENIPKKNWSVRRQNWCCEHHGLGCNEDICHPRGVRRWSVSKRLACCASVKVGCDAFHHLDEIEELE